MKKPELIILIGNIGSGKSTYAKKYQKRGHIVIARDQLRYAIGDGKYIFNRDYEPVIWKTELYMFKRFANLGVNMVIDEVGLSRKVRARYIPYAKLMGYKIIAIVMPFLDKKTSVNRRMKNPHGQPSKKLWSDVWTRFEIMYEPPLLEEGFNQIYHLKG